MIRSKRRRRPITRPTERIGIPLLAQFDHQLLSQIVIDRPDFLQATQSAVFQLIRRQMRLPNEVRINRPSASIRFPAGIAPLKLVWAFDTEDELSTPSNSRSSRNCRLSRLPLPRSTISQVRLLKPNRDSGIARTTGRNQQRECGRFQPHHRLDHQRQTVPKR